MVPINSTLEHRLSQERLDHTHPGFCITLKKVIIELFQNSC